MQPFPTDGVALSVSLSVTTVSPAKAAEVIVVMLFGLLTRVGPRNHTLGGSADAHMKSNLRAKRSWLRTRWDMSGIPYTQSNSTGDNIGMVQMPIGVY